MPKISRRGFLVVAAGAAAVGTGGPSACASVVAPTTPATASTQPARLSASGALGPVSASVDVVTLQDVVAINYTVTNSGPQAGAYTVSYVDEVTGRASRQSVVRLAPGATSSGVLYGSLNHDFTVTVGLPDGTRLLLGPVGHVPPSSRLSIRPAPSPLPQHGGN